MKILKYVPKSFSDAIIVGCLQIKMGNGIGHAVLNACYLSDSLNKLFSSNVKLETDD